MPADQFDSLRPDEDALLSMAKESVNPHVASRAAELVIGLANRLGTDEATRLEYFNALVNQFKS